MQLAYNIITAILFSILCWKWGKKNNADFITKTLLLIMAVWGLFAAILSSGILHR